MRHGGSVGIAILSNRGADFIAMVEDGNEANARLVAAAPELLEACKALLASAVEGECSYDSQGDEWPEIQQARAVIAKAQAQ